MKNTYWGYWLIVLGIFVIVVMMIINNITTTKSQDYYLVKEIAQASMIDAIDYSYYSDWKELRINKEKFVESFIRRFADSVTLKDTYTIEFYDLYEAPPKVSVRVQSATNSFTVMGDTESFDIVERVDAILKRSYGDKSEEVIDHNGIIIDDAGRTVKVDGKLLEFSLREYELLKYLVDNENIALSRDKILNNVWNYDYYGDSRTIDSHIKKIRHKLGKKGKYIKTMRGVGYKFETK